MTEQDLEQVNKLFIKGFRELWDSHLEPAFSDINHRFDVMDLKINRLTDILQGNKVLTVDQAEEVKKIKFFPPIPKSP